VQNHLEFDLKYDFSKDIWICDCDYLLKSGTPCSHQIKVIVASKLSVVPYFH
jgi:hypothetical protein